MLLLDVDNTIIPSFQAYEYAISELERDWIQKFGRRGSDFRILYERSREVTRHTLKDHPSKRQRILYFKKMAEIQDTTLSRRNLSHILAMERRYFHHFLHFLRNFKKKYKSEYKQAFRILKKIQSWDSLVFISNENLRTQLLKLKTVVPGDISFQLVTSEEVGKEKPHPDIFQAAIERGNALSSQPYCIIGDSMEDDILGGVRVGLSAIHQTSIWGNPEYIEKAENGIFKTSNLITSLELFCQWRKL